MRPFHPEAVAAPLRHWKRGRKHGRTPARERRRPVARRAPLGGEEGNAVVEFVFLGVVLLVPVVYLVLTVGQLQGGSFAVVGAADQAAKVYVDAPTPQAADARARQAVRIALSDFGFSEDQAAVDIACSEECLAPGSTVTVVVRLEVPLPLIPGIAGSHASAATVDATSTQIVERFG
jgi:Flp pilus assembly protein TadG